VTERKSSETSARELVYFAAERTLMAWIRSALGLMALGFVIDRFGIVVQEVLRHSGMPVHDRSFSFWSGAALVVGGSVMAVVAAIRYTGLAYGYRREGIAVPGHGLLLGVFFTVLIALAGAVIAAFLFSVVY